MFTSSLIHTRRIMQTIAGGLLIVLFAQLVVPSFVLTSTLAAVASLQTEEVTIPDGTEIEVITLEELTSKTAVENDPVEFKVNEDVKVGNNIVITKGTIVKGIVSEAEKSGRMGRSGKLNIRVESTVAVDGQKVKLRAAKSGKGGDKTGTVIALSLLVSPLFLLKRGKEAKVKAGTKLKVFTDEEKKVQVKS